MVVRVGSGVEGVGVVRGVGLRVGWWWGCGGGEGGGWGGRLCLEHGLQ